MRLPNGYGSVYKLSGRRRNPWIARKTKGWITDANGKDKQEYHIIGYYDTRQNALQGLAEYNKNPYDVDAGKTTFAEVYEKWSLPKFESISHSNALGYQASYKLCASLYDMKFSEIRTAHLQRVVDTCGKNHPTLRKLKVLFSQLYDFAMKNDVCAKDYSDYINIGSKPAETKQKHFTEKEVGLVWKAVDGNEYIQIILMLIYSGVRISELLDLKKSDVHLSERWFLVRESKTDAGRMRQVPIAKKMLPFYENWLKKDCEYLICTPDNKYMKYYNYRDSYWNPLMETLGLKYTAHATRHTAISMLATAKVDQTIIKKIVGHSGAMTLTEKVYTHFDIAPLLEAIDKI